MVLIIDRDCSGGQRADVNLFFGPSSKSPSTASPSSGSSPPTPKLEMDKLDTSPFSECFSAWFDDDSYPSPTLCSASPNSFSPAPKDNIVVNPDFSYDIEYFTNIRDVNPHWDHQIDEIMVLSPKDKTRLPRNAEEPEGSYGRNRTICISDFESIHVLRRGSGAEVTLCRKRDTNKVYALKSVRLRSDSQRPRSEHALLKVVHRLGSPFLPSLYGSFENSECIYFVMDFYPGGNLLTHITRSGTLHPDRVHFYACEIVEGLAALHTAGIVHRDLKPENIMVDADGHITMTGFGYAKVLGIGPDAYIKETITHFRMEEYQAPEMHLGWVHDFSVDCWAFGILIYVMLFGRHPFTDQDESQNLAIIRSKVVQGPTPYQPFQPIGTVARDLITKCLERNPAVRFNIRDIRTHRYFSGVDWASVASKTLTVPWVPELDGNRVDLRYFDTQTATMEDISISPTPKDLKEPTLASPAASQMQNDIGETVVAPLLQSAAKESSGMMAHARKVPRILQPCPAQVISRGARRHSACLDAVLEADEEGLDEPQNAIDLTDGVDLKNRLEEQLREQVAKNRASFWDTLSDERSVSSRHSLDFKDALGLSPPRPRKLRKRKSFAFAERITSTFSISTIARKERIKSKLRRVQIVSSPVMISPNGPTALDLPTGIVQTGQGIGFTYSLGRATLSNVSICSTTPGTCHGLSLKGFPRFARKAKGGIDQGLASPMPSETDEDQEMTAVMKEVYGSTWSLGMSAVNLSQPLAYATSSSPVSSALSPGLQTSEAPEFAEADEVIAGDPDTTLRLVSPSSL